MTMKNIFKGIAVALGGIVFLPHLLTFIATSKTETGKKIKQDLSVYKAHRGIKKNNIYSFLYFLIFYSEYRNVFYFRLPIVIKQILYYCPPRSTLHIWTKSQNVGGGLYVGHGWGTVINAKKIGNNCIIGQNVTIGSRNVKEPILGDNVGVYANAVVLGDITIGNNTQIGAGAVVVKSVPANCVVTPAKSNIIKKDGIRVNIPL